MGRNMLMAKTDGDHGEVALMVTDNFFVSGVTKHTVTVVKVECLPTNPPNGDKRPIWVDVKELRFRKADDQQTLLAEVARETREAKKKFLKSQKTTPKNPQRKPGYMVARFSKN